MNYLKMSFNERETILKQLGQVEIKYLSEDLRNDKEFILQAIIITKKGNILKLASK